MSGGVRGEALDCWKMDLVRMSDVPFFQGRVGCFGCSVIARDIYGPTNH